MKKKAIFLALAALLLLPVGLKAQELTVCDGSATSDYVPIWGLWLDNDIHTQSIYPASELTDLVGSDITQMTWYLSSPPSSTWSSVFTIRLMTTTQTAFTTTFIDVSSVEEVYSGTLTVSGGEMTVELDAPFTYNGDNLLVDFQSVAGNYSSCTFKGITPTSYTSIYKRSGVSSATTSLFLPKLTIEYSASSGGPVCRKPLNLAVSNITTEGADFSWNTRNGESSWKVYIDGVEQSGTVNDSSYTVSGLSASSQHTFGVAAVCDDGGTSGITSITFRTACGVPTLPWSEDFETYATGSGNHPDCWAVLASYTSYSTTYPYISTSGGSKCYYMYSSITPNFVRTPMFNQPANQLQVVFRASVSSYGSGKLEAGVMTDSTDTTTFIPVLTITGNSSTWTEYEFFTDELTATDNACVAFRWRNNSGYSAYIDDIAVAVASECRRPVNPAISNITYEGATISWTDNGSGATEYVVRCAKSNDVNAATAIDMTFNSSLAVVTGLDANTTYYAWVRTNCGDETTLWRACGSFTTDQNCYPVQSLTVADKNRTSALITWAYQNRGRENNGVNLRLIDLTATDTTNLTATGTSQFLTGLESGHNYRVDVFTQCDTFAASAQTVSFETETCGQMRGTTTTSYAPTYNTSSGARNSYTQSVYPASLLEGISEVSSLRWRISSTPSGGYTRAIKVYLGTTDTLGLDSTAAHHPAIDEMTLVYDGTVNLSSTGWLNIDLSNPWSYDGSSNVVVAVLCNSGESSGVTWGASSVSTYSTIYWYAGQSTTLDPATNLGSANYSRSYSLPDITFVGDCQTPACLAPLATVESTSTNSISLTWIAGSSESNWVVEHRLYGDTTWTVDATVGTTSYTVEGLDNSTLYEFRVGSVCGNTLYSPVFQARTDCGTISLPFTETFEGWSGSNAFPTCWYKMLGTSSYPSVSNSASYRHSGTASMYSSTSSSTVVMFASPEVPTAADNIKVSFWAYNYSTSGTATQAGIVTDPSDPSSFVPCTVVATGITQNSMSEYEFYTDNVSAVGTVHVAFRFATSNNMYIDDVTISEAGNCRRPNTPSVNNVTYYGATLHWNDVNNGSVSYQVCYNTVNDLESATIYSVTTNEDSIAIDGLQNGQRYYTWVRPSCSTNDADWLPMPYFTTEVSCYPVQNLQLSGNTFTTAAVTWDYNIATGLAPQGIILSLRDNSDGTMVYEDIYTTDNAYIFTGLTGGTSYTLFASTVCDPDSSAAVTFTLSTKTASCAEAMGTTSDSTYSYPCNGYYNYSYSQTLYASAITANLDTIYGISLRVARDPQNRTWDIYMANTNLTALSTSNFVSASNLTQVASNYTFNSTVGWVDVIFDTPFINNGSNLVLAINDKTGTYNSNSRNYFGVHCTTSVSTVYSRNDDNAYNPASITTFGYYESKAADIKFIGPCELEEVCTAPVVVATATTTSSVTLQVAADDASSFQVQYKTLNGTTWVDDNPNLTTTTYTVEGLTASTGYQFRVGITCGDSTLWSNAITAYTECEAMSVPQTFTFSEELSPCWTLTNSNVYRSTSYTPNVLYFSGSTVSTVGRAVLPEFATDITSLKLTIHARRGYSSESVMVGVGNSQGGDVTWIETIPLTNTYGNYTVYFDSYTGEENRIVLTKAGTNTMYMDSITVEEAESCRPVHDLTLTSATETSATISWTHSSATSFDVEYHAVGESTWLSTTASGTSTTLTGLTASTGYVVRVRANCSASDQSPWCEPYAFRTECGLIVTFPYTEDFESYNGSATPDCWNVLYGYTGYPYVGTSASSAHGGTKYLYNSNYYNGSSALFCTPTFGVNANTLTGSVWMKAYGYYTDYGYDYYDYEYYYQTVNVEIGVMTDPSDESTFTPILDTLINTYNEATDQLQWIQVNFSAANSAITSNAAIAFRINMDSESDNAYVYIDDLTINSDGSVGPNPGECNVPTITSANANETFITMVYSGTASTYEVGIVNGNTWSEPASVTTSTGGTYTFSMLTASTTYTIGVRAVCAGGERSAWATQTVTTSAPVDPTCATPSNIEATNVTANSATISWTAGGSETAWKVEVSGGGSTNVLDVSGTPSTNLTNLTASTAYTVRVRAVCSAASMSDWSQAEIVQTTASGTGIVGTEGNLVRLYPNPASSTVTVELDMPAELTVVDINGRQVYTATTTGTTHTIDVSAMARGTYFVRVITADGIAVSKLAVQ